ncbi:MAG: HD domain-containing protein [Acidobacteria bacterium]|nr:HD domain-containing protein [Acidobacteriota bacterium]MCA1642592.1 HD domain-containing protein [Acidobacteriota bacterium]
MRNELSLDANGGATVKLLDASWANYLQHACARLKSAGQRHKSEGAQALVRRLKRTRPSTYDHCVRVARVSRVTGRAFGFDAPRLQQLSATAMMHDIGKILVPESVLSSPRKPSRFEHILLDLHPTFGALLASYFNLPAELRIRTEHHHERWDGRGYPHRLGGTDIPLMARIVQVADTYDAMITKRSYNQPRTHADAVAELRAESGKQFDPRVVEAFLDAYPAGDEIGY